MSWDVAANGMLYVSYDTNHNGIADFHTLRVVTRAFYSFESIDRIARNFPNHLVFRIDKGDGAFYYVAAGKPLLYAIDINEDGHWDLIYKDNYEDGVNGNEEFYDSPSGMFRPETGKF